MTTIIKEIEQLRQALKKHKFGWIKLHLNLQMGKKFAFLYIHMGKCLMHNFTLKFNML